MENTTDAIGFDNDSKKSEAHIFLTNDLMTLARSVLEAPAILDRDMSTRICNESSLVQHTCCYGDRGAACTKHHGQKFLRYVDDRLALYLGTSKATERDALQVHAPYYTQPSERTAPAFLERLVANAGVVRSTPRTARALCCRQNRELTRPAMEPDNTPGMGSGSITACASLILGRPVEFRGVQPGPTQADSTRKLPIET